MIVDSQTNFVYLADSLARKYPKFARRLTSAFDENAVRYDFLPNTKDVWAVDYMPVQVAEDEFIRFNYSPDYLTSKKYAKTISDVDTICTELGIETTKTDIIADGGNLVCGQDYVLMTEKIFYENKKYNCKINPKIVREKKNKSIFFIMPILAFIFDNISLSLSSSNFDIGIESNSSFSFFDEELYFALNSPNWSSEIKLPL
jgi:agmatine deiminase